MLFVKWWSRLTHVDSIPEPTYKWLAFFFFWQPFDLISSTTLSNQITIKPINDQLATFKELPLVSTLFFLPIPNHKLDKAIYCVYFVGYKYHHHHHHLECINHIMTEIDFSPCHISCTIVYTPSLLPLIQTHTHTQSLSPFSSNLHYTRNQPKFPRFNLYTSGVLCQRFGPKIYHNKWNWLFLLSHLFQFIFFFSFLWFDLFVLPSWSTFFSLQCTMASFLRGGRYNRDPAD